MLGIRRIFCDSIGSMKNIADIVNKDEFDKAIADGLIRVQTHNELPLKIYTYSKKAEDNSENWNNPSVVVARGLILDYDGNVVSRSFDKFFNFGQYGKVKLKDVGMDATVRAYDKKDGVLAISYPDGNGNVNWASKGSFQSPFAKNMNVWYKENMPDFVPRKGWTYICEYVGHNSKIILDYDTEELILLAARNVKTGEIVAPENVEEWTGSIAEKMPWTTLRGVVEHWNDTRGKAMVEGQVVYIDSGRYAGTIAKAKTDDYMDIARVLSGFSYKKVVETLFDKKAHTVKDRSEFAQYIAHLPDEIADTARIMKNNIDVLIDSRVHKAQELVDKALNDLGYTEVTDDNKKELSRHISVNLNQDFSARVRANAICLINGQKDNIAYACCREAWKDAHNVATWKRKE